MQCTVQKEFQKEFPGLSWLVDIESEAAIQEVNSRILNIPQTSANETMLECIGSIQPLVAQSWGYSIN